MKKIFIGKAPKTQNGSVYATRLKVDYGVPHMRINADASSQNVAVRTGLSSNKMKQRVEEEKVGFQKVDSKIQYIQASKTK